MSKKPAVPGGHREATATRRGWTMESGQAEVLVAGARSALFVMVGVLAVLWIIQIANWADHYGLNHSYGIIGRDPATLPYIFTAPLLHVSWAHIEGNSGPLFIFGFLAAYRGIARFAGVTVLVVVTSGLAAWFFEGAGVGGVGASGVVFGYFGYIMVRGLFDRHGIDVLVGAVMALCFAYQFSVLLPQQGIGWQAHIGGLAGGVLSGWVFRERRAARSRQGAVEAPSTGANLAVRPAAPTRPGKLSPGGPTSAGPPTSAADPASAKTKRGKGSKVDPANPRADLYKELDDLGL
jgi:membrane associated rhomboid family serine protease